MKRLASHPLLLNSAVAVVYLIAAKIGLSLAFGAEQVTAVWPPTGIALAGVLIFGVRIWPGILLGAFLANSTSHEPLLTALGIAAGNTCEALVGAYLLRRVPDFQPSLSRIQDVLHFLLLAAGASTMLSATMGTLSLCLGGVQPWSQAGYLWLLWWLGDAMGDVVFAPLVLTWAFKPRQWRQTQPHFGLSLLLVLILADIGIFWGRIPGVSPTYPLEYLVFPLVIGAAFACGQAGVSTAAFITSLIAIVGTVKGSGPFSQGPPGENLVLLQLYMGVVAVTGLLLGAALGERRSAEEALQRSDLRSRFAMEAGEVGVFEWDIQTGRVFWSDNLFAIHRTSPGHGERTFDAFMEGVHPEDRRLVARVVSGSLETGEKYEVEYRSQTDEGRTCWYSAKGQVVKGVNGTPERMIGVCSDVTARRELEEGLRAADRQKDQFVAMLAHELRNPLAPIRNAAHLLDHSGSSAETQRYSAIIQRQAAHMARLLDDLLDVSRINRGQVSLQKSIVDFSRIVERAVEDVRPLCQRQQQQLAYEGPEGQVLVEADPTRVYQIASNLLHNASKYTESGGAIRVVLEAQPDWVTLRVADTGVGINAEFLPHMFDLFSQDHSSMSRSEGGLGIGLTLVKTLARLHGGSVDAYSDGPGKGSELVVRFPVSPSPTPAPHTEGDAAIKQQVASRRLRVLIVDDNQDAAVTLGELVEMWGHEVRTVGDGTAALLMARAFLPDVVLLDIGLPVMDGYEVARRLRSEPKGAVMLLVAVTGYGREEDQNRGLEAGFDRHCAKPVEPDLLRDLIESARPGTLE